MFRRNPTRIELKLEDQTEYDQMKKEMDEKKRGKDIGINTEANQSSSNVKKQTVQERIGFVRS